MRRTAWLGSALGMGVFGAFAAASCGPAPETICKRLCDCGGCVDQDEEEGCAEALEEAEKEATDGDCGAEYDAYVGCLDESLECKGDAADTSACDDEYDDLVDCIDEPVVLLYGNGCIDLCVELAGCANVDPGNCQVENPCNDGQNKCAACLAGGSADLCDPDSFLEAAFPCLTQCLDALECQPGTQQVCACPDGSQGVSTCNGATFGECECEPAPQ